MKRFSWLMGLLLLCSTQMSYARDCGPCPEVEECSLCDFDICDVCYSVYVDALYWQVARSELDDGDCPDWDWGFRLGGYAKWRNWDLGVRWTSFETDSNNYDIDFDVVDIELGYAYHMDCAKITIRPFVGAKLAWIDEEIEDDDTRLEGYGLMLGAEARWDLCGICACDRMIPISFITRGSTAILHGEFHRDNDGCQYVPVHELFVGLNFGFCDLFCNVNANFAVGYEVQHWGMREADDQDVASLGLGGLVLRFGASF